MSLGTSRGWNSKSTPASVSDETPSGERRTMTTVSSSRGERGRSAFSEVMTFAAPEHASPAAERMVDFVFSEIWRRPGLSRRDRWFVTLPCVAAADAEAPLRRSEEHTSELQSRGHLVCRLLLEK